MIKQIFSCIIIFSFYAEAAAQKNTTELGFQAGVNINSAYGSGISKNVKDNMAGLHIGGHFKINMPNHFGMKAVLAYDQNGWAYRNLTFSGTNGTNLETGDLLNRLNYLNLSMLAEQSFGKKIKFYLDGGIFTGFLLSNQMITKIKQPASRADKSSSSNRRSINFGVAAGAGMQIPVNASTNIIFGVQDNLGLSNIYKPTANGGNATMKTNVFTVLAGLAFALK